MRKRNFTETEQEEIIKLWETRKYTSEEIGNMYNVSGGIILQRLKDWKIYTGKTIKFSKSEKEKIIKLYKSGYSLIELGDEFNVSSNSILKNLNRWGVDTSHGKKFSQSDKNEIIKLYREKKFAKNIAPKFNVSTGIIVKNLKEWGEWELERGPNTVYFSKKDRDRIVTLYNEGSTSREIADRYGITGTTVLKKLNKWGIDTSPIRYEFNEKYFSSLDTRKKRYWVAFITGDGYVYNNILGIHLHSKDKEHLQKFLDDLDSNHPIKSYEKNKVMIRITSWEIVNDLRKYNIVPRKSLIVRPYELPSLTEEVDYWRGIVDSDGWLCLRKRGNYYTYSIGVCGTKWICEGFKRFVLNYVESIAKVHNYDTYSSYAIHDSKALTIIKLLYENAPVYLDRKHEIAQKIILLDR